MLAIIDYGMGNLRSVQKALEKKGASAVITQDRHTIEKADKVVLPGVGAMLPAMEKLQQLNLIPAIMNTVSSGKPFLGICLGLQLLFEKSHEGGAVRGLGVIPGEVKRFSSLKIPQMGWNRIKIKNTQCPLWRDIDDLSHVYFCHSFFVKPNDNKYISTTTDYGGEYCSSIYRDNLFGVQFHPEKSQEIGLKILENFIKL